MKNNKMTPHTTNDSDVKVVQKESLILVRHMAPPLLQDENLVVMGTPDENELQVLIAATVYEKIYAHSLSDTSREVGGFLVGLPYEWEGKQYVEIVDSFPGKVRSSSAVHWTISHDTWIHAQSTIREESPHLHIMGWYHTHPHMSVFLSTLDVDIHDGFFKELWHIALVVEPTRREAGFFIWNKKSLELAKGYRVAYPPSLPEKQRWIYPELRSSSFVHGSDFSIQSFYEPGCWHTRYYDGDKLIVKVRKSAVEDFEKMSKGQSSISRFGICLGHTSINPSSVGPEYLFEITQLRLLEESGMASLAEQLFNLPKRDSLQVMGLCMIVPKSLSANLFDNKEISILQHRPDFATLVYIMGTSDGLETCVWFDKSGRFVQRDLVELASITETAEMELVELLADIKRRTPDGNA